MQDWVVSTYQSSLAGCCRTQTSARQAQCPSRLCSRWACMVESHVAGHTPVHPTALALLSQSLMIVAFDAVSGIRRYACGVCGIMLHLEPNLGNELRVAIQFFYFCTVAQWLG